MRSHSYTSEGIVLARKNYGEADRIISVYSKTHGRLSLIAKGVRKLTSRKRGHIEVFSLINFQAITGRGLDIITEVELIDNFENIRKSLKKVSLAYFFCEVIGKITHENQKNVDLFILILKSLENLKEENELKTFRMEFIQEVLVTLGYWPKKEVLSNHDKKLEEVIERQIYSKRVGKRVLQ